MTYAFARQAPARRQFEAPYRGSCYDPDTRNQTDYRAYDCGPTDAAFIDGYYHDRRLLIGYVRSLGAPECIGTTAIQAEDMLDSLGIPCDHRYGTTIDLISSVVIGQNRPMMVAVRMGLIPAGFRPYDSFQGNHWLAVVANTRDGYGRPCKLVMDSNTPEGHEWSVIPDANLSYALLGDSVIPQRAKVVSLPDTATEAHPVWLDHVKAASGTIHFSKGAKVYTDPGKVAGTVGSSSSAPRVMTLVHTDGSKWSGYVLGDPYSGVRLVNNNDTHIDITVP